MIPKSGEARRKSLKGLKFTLKANRPAGRFRRPELRGSMRPTNPTNEGSARFMQATTAGITKAGTGIDGIVWNILGQTYVPKQVSESSLS
jgi:hypothetical protein